ncbi:unnamed protein product [Linum tenue]|uniref:Agenet-like domain-containing protein n=1 Tax=Linum tenue TaxID=586396 RepID=A0AAV0J0Z7_9ROSI|nr:unnamed protein product [Linum tenue]
MLGKLYSYATLVIYVGFTLDLCVFEAISDDPGFRGSWFAGTVIRREAKNPNRYVVEYDQLYEDESGEKLLQETLD